MTDAAPMNPPVTGEHPAPQAPSPLDDLRDRLRAFAAEREWEPFHTPKNLAMALSVEAAELLEHFQWLTPEASMALDPDTRAGVREELADVLLYLVRLADRLDVDLIEAAHDKMRLNALKYPVERARGSSRKYDRL
jgi:NTP pyrophosphatase (non-canonical NTP hydrolase)